VDIDHGIEIAHELKRGLAVFVVVVWQIKSHGIGYGSIRCQHELQDLLRVVKC
jgi:hypothetical protein